LAVLHPDLHCHDRTDDTYLTLEERCAKAYSLPLRPQSSALFVSIHVNSAQAGEASGFEILTKAQNKRVTFLDEKTPIENISLFSSHSLLSLNRLLNHRNLVVASNFEKTLSERRLPVEIGGKGREFLF
jgi:N-acetylmuramoyl-L-alanine amidase